MAKILKSLFRRMKASVPAPTRPRPPRQRERPRAGRHLEYSPKLDGAADPGEIVWTWVPYEDDPTQGKDRPVLVVGYCGRYLLALMLTSKDHDRDVADEARHGRHWHDVGAGTWDARRRPSEVRTDRVLTVDPGAVRREGAVLDPSRYGAVVDAVRAARR